MPSATPAVSLLRSLERQSVCMRCRYKLLSGGRGTSSGKSIRPFSSLPRGKQNAQQAIATSSLGGSVNYFSANSLLAEITRGVRGGSTLLQGQAQAATARPSQNNAVTITGRGAEEMEHSQSTTSSESIPQVTPLVTRRRRRRKESGDPDGHAESEPSIPLDASNHLSTMSAAMPSNSLRRLLTIYLSLSKPRLTFLIVLTTTAAYSIYPVPSLLSTTATHTPSLSTLTLLFLTTGTFLTSASANALNMLLEPAHDAKMSRTRNRPLVRGLISKRGALLFALATGLAGTAALYTGVNPTTAGLAFANILLYAFVYTPLKRTHVVNTWVGAVVGGIPPLMGWTAAAGQSATGDGGWRDLLLGEGSAGGWLLAALLFAWQFPHFNALSWTIREEYKHAGYKMLAWTNPARNARVALRYSVLLIPICAGLAYAGVVEKAFVPASMLANGWVLYEAVKFWRFEGKRGSARGLFWASVWHLPIVLVLAMTLKKGLWERVWGAAFGREEALGDEWYEDEDEEDGILGPAAVAASKG